jgi:hypothetical protein
MWNTSKDRYIREYFENQEKLDTKYLRFGKMHAEKREQRELNTGEHTEYEIKANLQGIPLLSFLDFYDENQNIFEEDKTGKIAWTQQKVQKHDQLTFYATMLKALKGKMPEYCTLNWIPTQEVKGISNGGFERQSDIIASGDIVSFKRVFDEREIERMEKLIIKTANEISEAYIEWLKDF